MKDSTLNTIYHRHRSAIGVFANGGNSIATDAALMSLALALEEASAAYNDASAKISGAERLADEIDQRLDESSRLVLQVADLRSKLAEAIDERTSLAAYLSAARTELSLLMAVRDELVQKQMAASSWMTKLGDWLRLHMPDMLSGAGDIEITDAAVKALRTLHHERNESDMLLAQLADWLDNEGETGDGNEVEIAISVIERLREDFDSANRELTTLIAERDDLRKKVEWREFELEKANAAIYGNGKSAPAATLVQASDAMMQNPTVARDNGMDWSMLSKEADDYRIGIEANRWKYGKVPKQYRLELLRCAAAHIAAGCGHAPTMAEFDAAKPQWMSTSTAHTQTFGRPWYILIDPKHEIEVHP